MAKNLQFGVRNVEFRLHKQNLKVKILKVLSILKEKGKLTSEHKTSALNTINADEIKQYIDAL